jgi:hypothetical protein
MLASFESFAIKEEPFYHEHSTLESCFPDTCSEPSTARRTTANQSILKSKLRVASCLKMLLLIFVFIILQSRGRMKKMSVSVFASKLMALLIGPL